MAQRADQASAGVAGAGGGTGLVLLAQALPANSPWREILLYAAPAVSVVAGAGWCVFQEWAIRLRQRVMFDQLRKRVRAALADPLTSDEHKARLIEWYQRAEGVLTQQTADRIAVLGLPPSQASPPLQPAKRRFRPMGEEVPASRPRAVIEQGAESAVAPEGE